MDWKLQFRLPNSSSWYIMYHKLQLLQLAITAVPQQQRYNAAEPLSLVRMRMASSMVETNILPSPIFPV